MISDEKFKVIDLIRKLIKSVYEELVNFPKKDLELKLRIINNSYDILELAYLANSISNLEQKRTYVEKIIGKIKTLDFLLNLSLDNCLIPVKKYTKLGLKIGDILKYSLGWLNIINSELKKQK